MLMSPLMVLFHHQSDFNGFTGRVAFDRFGLRRDYLLEILECTKGMALSHVSKPRNTLDCSM